jgi:hypothetical protein
MCYEEGFFRNWARKRAQRREKLETVVKRRTPAQAQQQAPVSKPAAEHGTRKETERELEIV